MDVSGNLPMPSDLLCLILTYEGSIIHDYQLDYIGSIYVGAYRKCFGWSTTFHSHYNIYMQLARHIHTSKQIWHIKTRKCRKHMIPWRKAFHHEIHGMLSTIAHISFEGARKMYWEPTVLDLILKG